MSSAQEKAREALRFTAPRSLVGRIFGVRMEADGCWFKTHAAIEQSVAEAITRAEREGAESMRADLAEAVGILREADVWVSEDAPHSSVRREVVRDLRAFLARHTKTKGESHE